jgi:hypothetical protein
MHNNCTLQVFSCSKCNSPEFISGFINVYKGHSCPWKVKDKSYSNMDVRKKQKA